MENYKNDLIQGLTKLVKWIFREEKFYNSIGKVISVDETEITCKVEIVNGETIEDVRLQQVASDLGIFMKPKINSLVVVGWSDKLTASIVMFSELDEIVFQNGENGGIPITPDVVSRLNNIESDINDLKTAFTTWVTVPQDGGAALKTATATWYATPLIETIDSDIENTKFKH
jgi:hypothetical protein